MYIQKLLTIAEVAEILRVHRTSVSRLLRTGEMPYIAIGDRKLLRPADVVAFIDNRIRNGGTRDSCRPEGD